MTSISLPGVAFSSTHNALLKAMRRSRGLEGDVWVSSQMAKLLGLTLAPEAHAPIALTADNATCFYHHSSAFTLPLAEMQRRWRLYDTNRQATDAEAVQRQENERHRSILREHLLATALLQDSDSLQPLNTNGEAFAPAVEAQVLAFVERWCTTTTTTTTTESGRGGGGGRRRSGGSVASAPSVYWAAPEEAAFIFQSPFKADFLADRRNAVAVPHPLVSSADPILYYNVVGAVDPAVYNAAHCQRYDPGNYCGAFYSPLYAVAMKRYAVQHGCMHEPRWLTPSRMRRYGATPTRGIAPLTFVVGESLLRLGNIALSSNRDLLDSRCVTAAEREVPENAEDAELLVVTQRLPECDDAPEIEALPVQ